MTDFINSNNGSLLPNRFLTVDQATPGTGPIAPVIDIQLSPRSDTYLTIDNNIRTKVDNSFVPIINAQLESSQQYVNDKYVNFTGREQIYPTVVQQINLKGHDEFHNLSIKDPRVTTKETTLYSASGNAERQHDGYTTYTYVDKPKTTTNETTLYSASGNAERQHDGYTSYTYVDKPKTTTNETTLYSYAGDVNGTGYSFNQQNRVQFTGEYETYNGDKETFIDNNGNEQTLYKVGNSGPTKWSQKAYTLVEDYTPGADGHQNVQLDPEEKIGHTLLNADWDITNTNGPGGYMQSLPNGEKFQQISSDLIGEVKINPYKPEGVDNRQTANYLINNLQINDFSIYQRPELRNKKYTSPFFIDSNAQDHSGIATNLLPLKELDKYNLPAGNFNVFSDNEYNPNSTIVFNTYGQLNPNAENPLLFQGKSPKNYDTFQGLGYSRTAIEANKYNPKILLDTDSKNSSQYLNYFSPGGCLNNVMKPSDVIKPVEHSISFSNLLVN